MGIDTAPNTQLATELSASNIEERAAFDEVVIGNGTGKIGGYFGWVINPDRKYWFSYHFYVSVLPSADIHNIALLANASGYETVLVTEPLEYDPFPPRVAVKHQIILYPNNVSICFTIIVLENGYVTVKVSSTHFLRDDWMRTVFSRMLQDICLPPDTISHFGFAIMSLVHTTPSPPQEDIIVYFFPQGGSMVFLNVTKLTQLAETIVIGNVTEILPSRLDPETGTIYTDVIVDVETCMKISLNQSTIVVRTLGGTVGNLSMGAEDEAGFTEGERVLLFLGRTELYGNALHVIGGHQGKYTLQNGMAINKDPSRNTTLEELLEEIQEAV